MSGSNAQPDAVVAVIRREERILLIERAPSVPGAGFWAPPAGKIEPGESQERTLVREVHEELGLRVTPLAKVWECRSMDRAYLLHWWLARPAGRRLRPNPREVSAARWLTRPQVLALDRLFDSDRHFFEEILPGLE